MLKRYSLLITLVVSFLFVVVLTWIIAAGNFSTGGFASSGTVPLGIADLFKVPLWTASMIFQFSLIFLLIGGFYGVLNKTGVYTKVVDAVVKKFKKKENIFLIICVSALAFISSVMGGNVYLFILVPFLIAVLVKLGFGKIKSLLATVGALFIGTIGSTFGFDINGYINYYLSQDVATFIWYKIALLFLSTGLLLLFLIKLGKKEEKVEAIPLLEEGKTTSKRSALPLVIVFAVGMVLALVGTFSWSDMYGIEFFTNLHTTITGWEISGYPIVSNILGTVSSIGNWSVQDVNVIILVMTLVIGLIYKLRIKDIIVSFIRGAKEMLPVFGYATLANIIIVILMNGSGSFVSYTIMNFLYGITDKFNALIQGLVVATDSFFVNYFPYLSSDTLNIATIFYTDTTVYPVVGLITQAVYGFVMYVLPTSLLLVAGLAFMRISYKEWMKYIWKYLLYLLAVICAITIIAASFI